MRHRSRATNLAAFAVALMRYLRLPMDNDDRYLAKFTIATLALTLALLWAIT
jgi:hypothetical protein